MELAREGYRQGGHRRAIEDRREAAYMAIRVWVDVSSEGSSAAGTRKLP